MRVEGTKVEAWDYVSAASSLLMRERAENQAWTEWTSVHDVSASTDEIEVKDEEGNIGKVSLALRGRADPTITGAGSGCGCKTSSSELGGSALLALPLALLATRRRRRSSDDR